MFLVDGRGTVALTVPAAHRVHADSGFRPFGADFAESVAVTGDAERYTPGDLLVIDASGERRLSLSQRPYSTLVAGIYSTQLSLRPAAYLTVSSSGCIVMATCWHAAPFALNTFSITASKVWCLPSLLSS